jgi:hypothetical protein
MADVLRAVRKLGSLGYKVCGSVMDDSDVYTGLEYGHVVALFKTEEYIKKLTGRVFF